MQLNASRKSASSIMSVRTLCRWPYRRVRSVSETLTTALPMIQVCLILVALITVHAGAQQPPARVSTPGSPISAAAFSPKEEIVAFGGYRVITLRNAKSGKLVSSLSGNSGAVTSLAYSPNGEILAAAGGVPGQSGEIKLWNIKTRQALRTLTGPVDVIYGVSFRPDGRQIAGCSYDYSVTLWDLPERLTPDPTTPLHPSVRLRDHTDAVYAVAYSPDGTRIASAAGDRTVKVWDVKTGKRLYTLNESTAELYALAFRPNGKQLAAGGVDKTLRVWNLFTDGGTLTRSAFAHEAAILRVVYTHDGKSLLTSGQDNAVKRWNADTLEEEKIYPRQSDWPQGLAVSPADNTVAIGCHDGAFALYDLGREKIPTYRIKLDTRPPADNTAVPTAPNVTRSVGSPFCSLPVNVANETPDRAQGVTVPASISCTLWNGKPNTPAPVHYYRFTAKKDETLVIEVMARRAGSLLDSEIAVCDLKGKPLERAVLRAVGQTEVTLSDRDSVSPGIRLLLHPDLHLNDYVLAGRELLRIAALPKGPDDDYQFRSYRGQRTGFLGTTPEYHSVGASVYKVEIHPPGSTFSPNGMPLTHLTYQNDDGGPLYGRDSYLEFKAPADGDFLVRLNDARGQQGEKFTYTLNIHPPHPDFKILFSPASPAITNGGSDTVNVECERYDGFNSEISLRMEGLPPGFTATQTVIEAGENAATILLTAAPITETPMPSAPDSYRVVATATIGGREVSHTVEPDEKNRRLKIVPPSNVALTTNVSEVTLNPGHEAVIEGRIERRNKFGGRVPLEVRNLPFGVRVLDVGLNGVLITEKETARKFVLYCEPWVTPQTRPIYIMALPEGQAGNAAPPVLLKITRN